MKGSEQFKQTIEEYLNIRATIDPMFARRRAEVDRSIDDIVSYILSEVQKSGKNGFNDEEIYGMAVHAAEEPTLDFTRIDNAMVTINHHVELTEDEKAEQKAIALKRFQDEQLAKLRSQASPSKTTKADVSQQPSLF